MDTAAPTRREPPPGHQALRSGRRSLPWQAYLLTFATRKREPLFRDFDAARALAASLHDPALAGDGRMLAWVVMPEHVHCLFQLGERRSLPSAVAAIKSGSARRVNQAIGRSGALWERAYHDRALRADEDVRVAARYLVANPLRAGLVERIGDYPFWNAVWLHDQNPV